MPTKPRVIDETYLHISNGGTTFAVVDGGQGPTLEVRFGTFGHQQVLTLHTTTEALRALGEMFIDASEHERYSDPYCFAAGITEEGLERLAMRPVQRLRREGRHAEARALLAGILETTIKRLREEDSSEDSESDTHKSGPTE